MSEREKWLAEHEAKTREKIDQFLNEKRYDEAAALATHLAFIRISPEELTKLLLNAIKELKAKKLGP